MRVDGSWDIECARWTTPVVIVTNHRVHGVETHTTLTEAVSRMMRLGGVWVAHNGGHYDSLGALEVMRATGVPRMINVSQGRVVRSTGSGLTLSDSFSLVPLGLSLGAELGNVPSPELGWTCSCGWDCGGYCTISTRMSRARRAELTDYCVQDTRALLGMIDGLTAWADELGVELRSTVGATAWHTLKRDLDLPKANYTPSTERRIREAYYGGRIGVYRTRAADGRHWDMTGAYPSAMVEPVPVGACHRMGWRSARAAFLASKPGVYSCTVRVPESFLPPLPWRHAGRIYYPYGEVSGSWVLPEILAAIEDGCVVTAVHGAVVWEREEALFADHMRRWVNLRVELGKDSAKGKWLKHLCNSGPGKFAERGDRMSVRLHPTLKEIVRCHAKPPCTLRHCTGRCGKWSQLSPWGELWGAPYYRQAESAHVQWAATITAHARIAWRREAMRHEGSLVYGHTDSIWTTSHQAPTLSSGPGGWELVDTWQDFVAVAPGQYQYRSTRDERTIIRTSGAKIRPEDWQRGESVQDRGAAPLLVAARGGRGYFVPRRERWTLPESSAWVGDRIRDGEATRPPHIDEIREKGTGQ